MTTEKPPVCGVANDGQVLIHNGEALAREAGQRLRISDGASGSGSR